MLDRYNYDLSKQGRRRKRALKNWIQSSDFDTVYLTLKNKTEEVTGYKQDRLLADINWMKRNKNKYYQTVLEERTERGKSPP